LKRSLAEKKIKELQSISHSLKGAASNFMLEDLRELALNIEKIVSEGKLTGIDELLIKLEAKIKILVKEVDAYSLSN